MERSEALDIIRKNWPDGGHQLSEALETLIPELKESEDERIRKELLTYLEYEYLVDKTIKCSEYNKYVDWLAKQGSQILANSAKTCKDEVKFKVGDWVVYDHRPYQVVELPKEGCINLGLKGNRKIEFAPSPYCRLWTIQDAEDGDILVTPNQNIFIFKEINGTIVYDYCGLYFNRFCEIPSTVNGISERELPKDHVPATKEQCDLLFQKMREAGYEWSSEHRKLMKMV